MASQQALQQSFRVVVENVLNRWTALRLAVEHGMGGPLGLNTAIELIDYVTSYCTENKNVDAIDLREVLEEIMDQEFETICEDESTQEVSAVLIKYLRMLKEGKEEEVKAELHTMVPCEMWIVSGAKIKYQPIDDSGSESDEDTNDPEEMDVEPASAMDVGSEQVNPSTCGSSTKFIEEEAIDPGWTQVRGRRRR
uniref:Pre-rRNA-processing protein TSR2 homolog n=1 Tax=Anopheles quadriannulatus TaxID=34691 RepID=A0A182XP19_ANOQN